MVERHDRAVDGVRAVREMPDRRERLFIQCVVQSKGRLSKGKRLLFAELPDEELRPDGVGRPRRLRARRLHHRVTPAASWRTGCVRAPYHTPSVARAAASAARWRTRASKRALVFVHTSVCGLPRRSANITTFTCALAAVFSTWTRCAARSPTQLSSQQLAQQPLRHVGEPRVERPQHLRDHRGVESPSVSHMRPIAAQND